MGPDALCSSLVTVSGDEMMVSPVAEALSALSEASIIEYTGRCLFTSTGCDFGRVQQEPFVLLPMNVSKTFVGMLKYRIIFC